MTHDEALMWISVWKTYVVQDLTVELVTKALELCKRYQASYYDSLILAAANELEAKILYSEDLSHGQKYERVKAINPFQENSGNYEK